jgi:UDP-N-acetyl-2-amino-2-deoxyglucuronate dehydrogenase
MKSDKQSALPAAPSFLWTVWRTDDNGNTFVVQNKLTQAKAERLAADFEARGHKQLYWAEQEPTPDPNLREE